VCYVVHKTTLELERVIFTTLLVRQEGGYAACFPLDVPMVHSSTLTIHTDGERLTCGGFSLNKTVHFEASLIRGATQTPSSWAQPIVGYCHYGP
jgi:hypothetical protein